MAENQVQKDTPVLTAAVFTSVCTTIEDRLEKEEIVSHDPMVWCIGEFAAMWKQAQCESVGDGCTLSKAAQFVQNHITPLSYIRFLIRVAGTKHDESFLDCLSLKTLGLAEHDATPEDLKTNGGISQRKGRTENLHQNRMKELLAHEWIVMIGTTNDITKIFAHLPCKVGNLSVYTDGVVKIAYKLLEVSQLSPKLLCYNYEADDSSQQNPKKIFLILYQWPQERLPMEYSELLQLIALCKNKKLICASARRKEAFSLLHLLFTIVVKARGPRSVTQAFSLHSCFCNGAPLDRHEVLYAMRFLLDWSNHTNRVPTEIKKDHARWCQIYDHMSEFSRRHTNIVSIHPSHLTRLDGIEEANKAVERARTQVLNLSDRPVKKMQDRYRRKTTKEIQEELIQATKSTYGIAQSMITPVDINMHSMHNSTVHKTGLRQQHEGSHRD